MAIPSYDLDWTMPCKAWEGNPGTESWEKDLELGSAVSGKAGKNSKFKFVEITIL